MAAPRSLVVDVERLARDEKGAKPGLDLDLDSPSGKRWKSEKFPLSRGELGAFIGVLSLFGLGFVCIYLTLPASEYSNVKLPRTISDLRMLK